MGGESLPANAQGRWEQHQRLLVPLTTALPAHQAVCLWASALLPAYNIQTTAECLQW